MAIDLAAVYLGNDYDVDEPETSENPLLADLKLLLGIPDDDTGRDSMLSWIIDAAKARLSILLGGMDVPESLNHIVTEVAVIRFNRIGSEGFNSHTVEGESITFTDNDFDGFMDEIEAFLDAQESGASRWRMRFI